MTAKRFIIDDAGTLIDMNTRNTYDYVSDVCGLLNELHEENTTFREALKELKEIGDYQAMRINELNDENEQLKQENQRMTDKLNQLALEFLNYDMVTMGKATEISEMCYYDFLKYRKENGNPMELQL